MPYGEYCPAETKCVDCMGRECWIDVPEGYSGCFEAEVSHRDGDKIENVESYLEELARSHNKPDNTYTDLIRHVIDRYCSNYVEPYCGNDGDHNCQSGFGGKYSDGLIMFWNKNPVPRKPNTIFQIGENQYVISWQYHKEMPGEDLVEYEYD